MNIVQECQSQEHGVWTLYLKTKLLIWGTQGHINRVTHTALWLLCWQKQQSRGVFVCVRSWMEAKSAVIWKYLHGNRRSFHRQSLPPANSWSSRWRSSTALCCIAFYLWGGESQSPGYNLILELQKKKKREK